MIIQGVDWLDIINDLRGVGSAFYYDEAEEEATPTVRRDLHALLTFNYSGPFKNFK